jgi:hypothetical protein
MWGWVKGYPTLDLKRSGSFFKKGFILLGSSAHLSGAAGEAVLSHAFIV